MQKQCGDDLNLGCPFRWAAASDIGRLRQENEDTFIVEPEAGLFLVSDGMGGHKGGALAANIVAQDLSAMIETRLHELKSTSPRAIRALFKRTIVEQSQQLQMEADSESGYKGMGATLVMALIQKGRAFIANLGDSRIYRLRRGQLKQLTKDHSVVSELVSEGKIEPHEAENHAAAGQITHYVGMDERVAPHIRSFALQRGDRLLLCTDGLTDMVGDKDIERILRTQTKSEAACEVLVNAANAAGGQDNITVVVVDWLGQPQ
jgi:protein phosphatase